MKFLSDILAKAGLVVDGAVTLNNVPNATTNTNKFMVVDGSTVKYRTAAEVFADIGAVTTTINNNADYRVVTGSSTANTLNANPRLEFYNDYGILVIKSVASWGFGAELDFDNTAVNGTQWGFYGGSTSDPGFMLYRYLPTQVELAYWSTERYSVRSDVMMGWSATLLSFNAMDTALARESAGLVQINTGVLNNYASLKLLNLTATGLAGSGTRMVVANANGLLSTQAIPDAGVSSVIAGGGISVSTTMGGTVTVTNTGLLSATAGAGISVTTSMGGNLNIINTGILTATAGSGISVSVSTGGNLNVINTGLLTATAGAGISVSTSLGGNLNIINTGILTATAGAGISVSISAGGNLNITNTITNTNQLTNGAGFITGITGSMVTTALGYTPVNPSSLGSYAYRSSGLAELSGATFTGAVSGTSFSATGEVKSVSGSTSVIRMIASGSATYIQSGATETSNSSTPLYFTTYFGGDFLFGIEATKVYSYKYFGIGTTNPGEPLSISVAAHGLYSQHRPNAGIGVGQNMYLRFNTANGTAANYAGIYAEIVANTDGAQSGALALQVANAGTLISALRIQNTGQLRLLNYTSVSAFTGTAVATLGVDSSGNVITIAGGGGSFLPLSGGTLTGGLTGTTATFNGGASRTMRLDANSGVSVLEIGGSGIVRIDAPGVIGGRLFLNDSGLLGVGTTDFTYTVSDNVPTVGAVSNNRVFVNGSIQLLNNNDAIVIGRGTATVLRDEELKFGWGSGWHMTDTSWLRVVGSAGILTNSSDVAIRVQESGTSLAWRGRIGSFNSGADSVAFLGNYTGRSGVFGHNHALTAWNDLWVNTLGVYGQGNVYLSWNTFVKSSGSDTNNPILHSANFSSYALPVSSNLFSWNVDDTSAKLRFNVGGGGDDYIIGHSTSRGYFSRAGYGWHITSSGSFHVFSSGWVPLFGVRGGDGYTVVRGSLEAQSDIYLGTRAVWLSTWLNQALLTSSTPTFGGLVATGMAAWNTTTPGTALGSIQIGTANGTANAGGAITFAARDGGGGSNAQAGIYVTSDGSYGTRMFLATTDAYVTGSKVAVSINEGGLVNFVRTRPTALGNVILDAGNFNSYSPSLSGVGATGTWNINVTGNANNITQFTINQSLGTGNSPSFQHLRVNGAWNTSPYGSGHAQLTVSGSYASIYQTSTDGNLGYVLHHLANDGAYYVYTGRGAVNGSDWNWGLRVYPNQDGNYVEFRTSARAPIFYDSADTSYYLDANSYSRLWRTATHIAPAPGVGSGNWVADFQNTATSSLSFGGDLSTGGPSGTWWFQMNMRHSNSSSFWGTQLAFGWEDNANRLLQRNVTGNNFSGWVEYANTGNFSRLSLMYYEGFTLDANTMSSNSTGFTYSVNAPYTGPIIHVGASGYGLQFNANYGDGTLLAYRVRNGDNGTWQAWRRLVYNSGTWDISITGNSGYSSNSGALNGWGFTSYAYRNGGSGYYQINDWLQMNGAHGVYWPSYYSFHIRPNITSTYCQMEIIGSKNSYGGIWDNYSAVNVAMYDGAGNGGVYREANGRWYWYYHVGNASMGVNGSTTSSSYALYVNGAIYATSDICAYSDRRKKTNIVTIENALDKVSKMRGVFYDKIGEEHTGRQLGVIAQEVEEVLPEAVSYAADIDEYGVKYGNMVGLLLEAIKEQQGQIEDLKKQIEYLVENR